MEVKEFVSHRKFLLITTDEICQTLNEGHNYSNHDTKTLSTLLKISKDKKKRMRLR